jgi:hypothetical protein
MPQDTLTITDNRTGHNYTLPVENGTIRAMDLRKIKTDPEDFGLMTYDPAFMNTASCRSKPSPSSTATRESCAIAAIPSPTRRALHLLAGRLPRHQRRACPTPSN